MALGKGIGLAGLFDLASGDVRQRVRRTPSHRIKVPHHRRPRSRAAAPAVWRQRCHPTHSGSPRVDIRRYGSADARRRHRKTGREIVILCDLLCWNSQQRRPDLSRYLGMIVHMSISSLPAHQAERQGLSRPSLEYIDFCSFACRIHADRRTDCSAIARPVSVALLASAGLPIEREEAQDAALSRPDARKMTKSNSAESPHHSAQGQTRPAKSPNCLSSVWAKAEMVSTRGFEPPTPGFIPLRLSPPSTCCRRSWSGLSLHHEPFGL